MPHDPEKYLYDIRSSCEFLLDFTAGHTWDVVEAKLAVLLHEVESLLDESGAP